jgi:hypothetical protein
MSKLFDVVMVGAFIDILYHVSERIQQIITDYEGFDKASIKAWGHAQQGAQDAAKYLLEYNKMQTEVSEAGLKGANLDKAKQRDKDIEIEQIKKLIHSKKEEMGVLGEFLDKVKAENDTILPHEAVSLGKYITGGHSFIDEMKLHGDTIDSLTEKYYKAQEAVSAYGKELARAEVDRAKDLVKESREPDKTTKRRIPGAEDHEEPNRLPWYLGPNAAEHFRDQLGGPKSLHGLPSASMTGGKIGSNFGGGGDESTGNKVVEVHTTIAPNFVFHGVPADVQAFMRNEAYPILSADLQNDIRGIKTAVREAVENSRG